MYISADNFTQIAVALIGAMAILGAAAIGLLINIRRHARAASNNTAETRDEVKNDHEVPLRDDLDQKFAIVNGALADLGTRLGTVETKQNTAAKQIGTLFRNDKKLDERLEQTQPHPPRRRKP